MTPPTRGWPADVASLLHQSVADHEPDRGRVTRRMGFDPAFDAPSVPGDHFRASVRRVQRPTRRGVRGRSPGAGWVAAAAGVAAALIVTVSVAVTAAVTGVPASPFDLAPPDVVTAPVIPPAPQTSTPTTAPTLSATTTAQAPTATTSAVPGQVAPGSGAREPGSSGPGSAEPGAPGPVPPGSVAPGPVAPGPVAPGPVAPGPAAPGPAATTVPAPAPTTGSVQPVASGHGFTLSGEGDWATTVRRDGRVVRSKATQVGALDVRWTGATPGAPGPYRSSWSGGAPEQSHSAATGWLAIGAGGSATISVPPTDRPARLTLYTGADGAGVVVTGPERVVWAPPGGGVGAAIITVAIPASASGTTVRVSTDAGAGGGIAGLAAAWLTT